MESIKIKIGGVDYQIKQSFRALELFEEITGKSASESNNSVSDLLKMFYSILKGCNYKIFLFSYDEFLDLIDDNPESVEVFTNYLNGIAKQPKETKPTKKKKP